MTNDTTEARVCEHAYNCPCRDPHVRERKCTCGLLEIAALRAEVERLHADAERISEAYGWLWCVNEEPGTPNRFPAEQAAYNARKLLRDMLTKEQRGAGINKAVIARNAAIDAVRGGERG